MENTELKFTRERPNDGIHDRVEANAAPYGLGNVIVCVVALVCAAVIIAGVLL